MIPVSTDLYLLFVQITHELHVDMPGILISKSNYRKLSCFIELLSNVYVSLQQFSFKTTEQKGKAENVGEVGAYPHNEACPHTLLFAYRVTSG